MSSVYQLPTVSLIHVRGQDAIKVLNGLCTAKLVSLTAGQATEAMFTDDRGRVLAHTMIALEPTGTGSAWILGLFAEPARLAAHIDRFIFREDATVKDVSDNYRAWLVDDSNMQDALGMVVSSDFSALEVGGTASGWSCRWPLTSPGARICLVPMEAELRFAAQLSGLTSAHVSLDAWQSRRIANFWPLAPNEISERTLPQELDRDHRAISFTKGCYLGQETVARLDALGEVQKKLCLVELDGWTPEVGPQASHEGKEVGTLTSVAPEMVDGKRLALAYMKRGWMKPGSRFTFANSSETSGDGASGVVIPHP